MQVLGFFKGCV